MSNHVHLVVLVPGDPEPCQLLESFKSYASRKLNSHFGKQSWWTRSGSTVKLPSQDAIVAAVGYVKNQEFPLVVWLPDTGSLQESQPKTCQSEDSQPHA